MGPADDLKSSVQALAAGSPLMRVADGMSHVADAATNLYQRGKIMASKGMSSTPKGPKTKSIGGIKTPFTQSTVKIGGKR